MGAFRGRLSPKSKKKNFYVIGGLGEGLICAHAGFWVIQRGRVTDQGGSPAQECARVLSFWNIHNREELN
jgi:hypothetical protein